MSRAATFSSALPSAYDPEAYSDEQFSAELARVHAETEIERLWIEEAGLSPFADDQEILDRARSGQLVRVGRGVGYVARQMLRDWEPARTNPDHKFHYSPPYLGVDAFTKLEELAEAWQSEMGSSRLLSITSLARSTPYQRRIAKIYRKLTITDDDKLSSHQVGLAFDIDSQGIVRLEDDGTAVAVNPRNSRYHAGLVNESRHVIRDILTDQKDRGFINFVEELPGTQNGCFHVCVNPII